MRWLFFAVLAVAAACRPRHGPTAALSDVLLVVGAAPHRYKHLHRLRAHYAPYFPSIVVLAPLSIAGWFRAGLRARLNS